MYTICHSMAMVLWGGIGGNDEHPKCASHAMTRPDMLGLSTYANGQTSHIVPALSAVA
jgi:hypothetical protein